MFKSIHIGQREQGQHKGHEQTEPYILVLNDAGQIEPHHNAPVPNRRDTQADGQEKHHYVLIEGCCCGEMDNLPETATGFYLSIHCRVVDECDVSKISQHNRKNPTGQSLESWMQGEKTQKKFPCANEYGKHLAIPIEDFHPQ